MTRSDFIKKVKELWKEVEPDNKDLDLLFQVVEIRENELIDVLIETSSCIVCHSLLLNQFIEEKGLEHLLTVSKHQVH